MVSAKPAAAHNSQSDNMRLLSLGFGDYQTNCYICAFPQGEIIIDAGVGADEWVISQCRQPIALLNTHGHFDHIWSNAKLKARFPNMPLVCPKLDSFMLESDCFNTGLTHSKADILIPCENGENEIKLNDIVVKFSHFPGHTPGCSIIEIEGHIFSGDFIFHRSIGRSDFPYSSNEDMLQSLQRFLTLPFPPHTPIYPGHGGATTFGAEREHIPLWIRHLRSLLIDKE